jgi:uncharacterized glyoxalase superfamily protein PhnB
MLEAAGGDVAALMQQVADRQRRSPHRIIREPLRNRSEGCDDKSRFDGFRLSLALATEDEAQRAFAGLSDGGQVQMPLTKTFWSPCFGMVTDRFGVGRMVTVIA